MRKSIIVIFFLVLILTVLLVIVYLLSGGKYKTSSYQIYSNASSPGFYPYIAWDGITSGKLLNYLKNEDRKGKLLSISPSAEPISIPGKTNPTLFDTNGLAFIQLSTSDFVSNKYKNVAARPFRFVAFFKTELGETTYFVLVEKWLNPDGSTAFLPLIIPTPLAAGGNTITTYYSDLISDDTGYFLSPILQIKSLDMCKTALPKSLSYCDWYFQNPEVTGALLGIMNEWIESSNIPEDMGRTPVVFTTSRLTKE